MRLCEIRSYDGLLRCENVFSQRTVALASVVLGLTLSQAIDVAAEQRRSVPRRLSQFVTVQPETLPTPEGAPTPQRVVPYSSQKGLLPVVGTTKYRLRYKHHHTIRRTCCGCCPPQKILLDVLDPCCKPVAIPVPVPGCCQGDPHVSTGRDILGRFSYTYRWRSGYKVDVVFRPRGDVVVHTWGR